MVETGTTTVWVELFENHPSMLYLGVGRTICDGNLNEVRQMLRFLHPYKHIHPEYNESPFSMACDKRKTDVAIFILSEYPPRPDDLSAGMLYDAITEEAVFVSRLIQYQISSLSRQYRHRILGVCHRHNLIECAKLVLTIPGMLYHVQTVPRMETKRMCDIRRRYFDAPDNETVTEFFERARRSLEFEQLVLVRLQEDKGLPSSITRLISLFLIVPSPNKWQRRVAPRRQCRKRVRYSEGQ